MGVRFLVTYRGASRDQRTILAGATIVAAAWVATATTIIVGAVA